MATSTTRRARAASTAAASSLVLAALLAAGCGIGWSDRSISSVEVLDDERTLVVGVHCDHDASVTAEETRDEVRLTLRVYGGYRGDCAEFVQLVLTTPLGDRRVVDASNDAAIVPCRAPAQLSAQPCS